MVAYTGIQGQNILIVSSDPSNPVEGQIWYNSTSNLLKGYQFATVNAWASGGNLNTARTDFSSGGTQTAAIGAGGYTGTVDTGVTELYNGTSWTSNPTGLNTARSAMSAGVVGTQTASLSSFGYAGANTTATESWNGSSWTSVNSANTARRALGGVGLQTAALSFGGFAGGNSDASESWNGTSWTTTSNLNTSRRRGAAIGNQSAALYATGTDGATAISSMSSWNGTSWTASPESVNTARESTNAAGTQTSGLMFGGSPNTSATELWNGTSWASNPTGLATARNEMGAAGTQASALAFGGAANPGPVTATEEWTSQALAVRTITTS